MERRSRSACVAAVMVATLSWTPADADALLKCRVADFVDLSARENCSDCLNIARVAVNGRERIQIVTRTGGMGMHATHSTVWWSIDPESRHSVGLQLKGFARFGSDNPRDQLAAGPRLPCLSAAEVV